MNTFIVLLAASALLCVASVYCTVANKTLSYAGLLCAMRNHFLTPWIYLLYSDSSGQTEYELLSIYKAVTNVTQVPIATVSFEDYNAAIAKATYVDTSPLHVVLTSDVTTKKALADFINNAELHSTTWLLMASKDFDFDDFFGELYIKFDTIFIVGIDDGNYSVTLKEVYQADRSFPLNIKFYGNWSMETGLITTANNFFLRRLNMEGKVITAAYMKDHANHEFCPTAAKGGFFGCVWNHIGASLNYTTRYILCEEGKDGKGGTTGMIDLVKKGKADVAIGLISATAERSQYVDFILPGLSTSYMIYMRQEEIVTSHWGKFIKTFDGLTWLYLWINMVLMMIGGVICYRYAPAKKPSEYFQSTFFVFASLCQQGSPQPVGPIALRMLLLVSYFAAVVFYTAYCSSLISALAVKDTDLFKSLDEFVNDASYRIGVAKYSAEQDIFNRDNKFNQSVYQKLMNLMIPISDNPPTILSGMNKVCSEQQYAFLANYVTVQPMMKSLPCPIFSLSTGIQADVSMAFKKNVPFFSLINNRYKARVEVGVIKRLKKLYLKESIILEDEPSLYSAVEISDLVPYYMILFVGFVLSGSLLAIEYMWHKRITSITQKLTRFFTNPWPYNSTNPVRK